MFQNVVLRDSGISIPARLLYAVLVSYAWKKNYCFMGKKTLAAHLGVSTRTVFTYTKELEAAKLIRVTVRGDGYTNVYTLLPLSQRYGEQIVDDVSGPAVAGLGEEPTFHTVGNFFPEAWNYAAAPIEASGSLGSTQVRDEGNQMQEEEGAGAHNSDSNTRTTR